MTEQDAVTLFEKKLGLQAEKEAITKLIAALDFMPLAIVQAAAYTNVGLDGSIFLSACPDGGPMESPDEW